MSGVTVNGFAANWTRLLIPWAGVWVADLDIDPGVLPTDALSAIFADGLPAIVTVSPDLPGTPKLLRGTVDGRFTGKFSNFFRARVVGGSGGWSKSVRPQHFNSPAGVIPSALVYAATAAEVLELPPIEASPGTFPGNYVRFSGAASKVFGDKDWHLDLITGIAQVGGGWPSASLPDTAGLLDFKPETSLGILACDGQIITPGMSLTDDRLGTTYTIRDVDQTFSGDGSTVLAWCGLNPVSRLAGAFKNAIAQFANVDTLKAYVYTVIVDAAGKLGLQSTNPRAPDLVNVTQWSGVGGCLAQLSPGTSVLMAFVGDSPAPYVVAVDQTPPLTITAFAPSVMLGSPAGLPLATGAALIALVAALSTFATTTSTATTAAQIATAAGTLQTALNALPPPATLLTKAS